ncbi:MAG TPA: hypothetical protein VNH40_07650 [Gaiellaceae bacterium]|nr:hypothetical protein [Gaiellaceae bacterium]
MPGSELDAEKLAVLRRWGTGLQTDGREEVSAAGKAILLLIEEIERLHVLVWDRRLYPDVPVPPPSASTESEEEGAASQTTYQALRDRLRRRLDEPDSTHTEPSPGGGEVFRS